MLTCLLTMCLVVADDKPGLPFGGTDFVQYYVACQMARAGANPYDPITAAAAQRALGRDEVVMVYGFPLCLVPYFPLSYLPFPAAVQLHLGLLGAALATCAVLWAKLLFPERPWLAWLFALLWAWWPPCTWLLGMGQTSVWNLLAFTGWAYASRLEKRSWAGFLLAFSAMKPHLGLVIVAFVLGDALRRRQGKMITAFILTLVFWSSITTIVMPDGWRQHAAFVQADPPTKYYAATLDGRGRWAFGPSFAYISWTVTALFVIGATIYGWKQSDIPETSVRATASLPLVSLLAVCASPHAFGYDYILLLPAFLAAIGAATIRPTPRSTIPLIGWMALVLALMDYKVRFRPECLFWWIPWVALPLALWTLREASRSQTAENSVR